MKIVERLSDPVSVPEHEQEVIERLVAALRRDEPSVKLIVDSDQEIELPEAVVTVLAEAVDVMARGGSVVVLPVHAELSPEQASRVLNVSRPYVTRLLDQGKIPFHRVGSHRRIVLSDLLAYKERRDSSRREELRRLSELSREMRIPE